MTRGASRAVSATLQASRGNFSKSPARARATEINSRNYRARRVRKEEDNRERKKEKERWKSHTLRACVREILWNARTHERRALPYIYTQEGEKKNIGIPPRCERRINARDGATGEILASIWSPSHSCVCVCECVVATPRVRRKMRKKFEEFMESGRPPHTPSIN